MDVSMLHTADGGDVTIANGQVLLDDGLSTAVDLSLFGGNAEDSGDDVDEAKQWWGNWSETDESRKHRSRTQYVLRTKPAIPANLPLIEDAMVEDTAWMREEIASDITATASLIAPRRVAMHLDVAIGDTRYPLDFIRDWNVAQ
jgi:phage gp46-like protein